MINSLNSLEFLKPKLITMDKFNCPATTKLLPPSSLTQTRTFVTISGHHHHNQQQLHHFNNNNSNNTIDSQQLQKRQEILLLNNEIKQQEEQERVKVQYVKNLTKLQNLNCWRNSRTLNNTTSASYSGVNDNKEMKDDTEIDVVNVEHLSPASKIITPINIQQQSAFNLDLKSKNYLNNNNNNNNNISICVNKNDDKTKKDSSRIVETNNNYKFYNQYGILNNNQTTTMTSAIDTLTTTSTSPTSIITQRTEDQNNAYRHIESVHNYAKSKSYEDDDNQSPNGSRHSSYLDDDDEEEDDDDEEDNDNDDVDYDQDDDIDYEERLDSNVDDLDADYEHIFNRSKQRRLQKLSTSSDGALLTKSNRINNCRGVVALDVLKKSAQLNVNRSNCLNNNAAVAGEDEEIHVDVDVETIESQSSSPSIQTSDMNRSSLTFNGIADESAATIKPDHHARRPMNAFLIFCKRHRAIVKERYKNLENRAITKILGDWWASLDANDKKCFTNLAQQNKDAFFSANPNFKWYKLPAPPLRTLSTRPATNQDYQDDNEPNAQEIISNNNATRGGVGGGDVDGHSNYFKLADEAQMGDLSQLMQDKTKTNIKQCADLQQALGETSQFMSAHITGNSDVLEENQNHLKRRYHNENSFSSNSSEDDVIEPKRKTARSCKGKRYQELINSGQIATAVKKSSKSSTERLAKSATVNGGNGVGVGAGNVDNTFEGNLKQSYGNVNNFNNKLETNVCQKRSISECETLMSYDLNGFDLEERIKELPALNLDDYLQRKRNTKKKKKFSSNGKKRGQRSSNHNNNNNNNESNLNKKQISNESLLQKFKATPPAAAPPTAVGSQKRKARKESITRRDVSAIEQEVASLLPLTINGCCYLQAIEKDTETTPSPQTLNVTSTTSPIIPLQQKTSTTTSTSTSTTTSSVSIDIFNNNNHNNNNTLNDNISSSTSDLLILAEVAANRTEL